MWFPLWYIQVYKIPQYSAKIYRFGQPIILFLESRYADVTKNVCYGCPQDRAKCPFFWLLAHGLFALITILLLHSATF